MIDEILGQFGVSSVDFPSGATREEIDAVIAKAKERACSADLLESPANPTNRWSMSRPSVRPATQRLTMTFARRSRSTTLSSGPLWAKPLAQGADLTIYSLTKYAGGHSDPALLGAWSVTRR